MRLSKFSLISLLVVATFVVVPKVFAETTPADNTKTIVLAEINVQDAKIVSQEGNTVNVSFNISNHEGAQSGIKYGIKVVKTDGKTARVVDEYVYPEVLSVGENLVLPKNVSYTAPAGVDGVMDIYVQARNYSGLPLGTTKAGTVTFEKQVKTIEILPETCSTSIERAKPLTGSNDNGIKISKDDKIILSCTVKNNLEEEITTTPLFETHYGNTVYGEIIPQLGIETNLISLRPQEEKTVSFTLPKISIPQSYTTKIYLEAKGSKSNYVLVNYTISGLSATIQNFSLDKNSYKANDTAKISFFWTSSATSKDEVTSITMNADIQNKNKRSCIVSPLSSQMAGLGFVEIPVTIDRACDDPEVSITLLDASGKVLDQKALAFEAGQKTNLFAGKTGIIAITILAVLIVAGIIMYIRNMKKKNKKDDNETPKSGHIEGAMLAIFFALAISLIPGGFVKASTYYITTSGTDDPYNPYDLNGTVILTANLDKSTYSEGDSITINSIVSYDRSRHCATVNLEAWKETSMEPVDFGGESIVCGGDELYASTTLPSSVTQSGEVDLMGPVAFEGISPLHINLPFHYTMVSNATVTVYATNVSNGEKSSEYITVNAGTPVDITWDVLNNTSGTTYYCHISTGGYCGDPISQNITGRVGGRYTPSSTTTYTVNDQP